MGTASCPILFVYLLQCQASSAVRNFIGQIYSPKPEDKIMLIGSDCSVSTEPIAEIASTWNLIQVRRYTYILSGTQIFASSYRQLKSGLAATVDTYI